ncbi:MAG: ATP-dependent Clp protease ATP-binding subunit [Bacilli bacterium]
MFDFFNLEVSKIFKQAEEEMFLLRHPYVGTEHLLLALLKSSEEVQDIFDKYNVTYELFKKELLNIVGSASKKSTYILYTPLLKSVIKCSLENAKLENEEVNAEYLLSAILEEGEGIAIRILLGMGVNVEKIYDEICKTEEKVSCNLELLKLGKNLNELVNMDEEVVSRDKEITYIIETLIRKNKNNPLLIGPAGVGKTAIVEELARRINKKEVPTMLLGKEIIMLEMGSLVAGTKYRGEFEERLTKIIKELETSKKYILFIDEIHSMVSAGGAEGAISASDIFKPYLARGMIKCIGATTINEYNKNILKDKALVRRFEVINIKEPNEIETKEILKKVKVKYEEHYKIKISDENINNLVDLVNENIYGLKNPDKSLDILDSVCAMISIKEKDNNLINCYTKKLKEILLKKEESIKENDFKKAVIMHEEEEKINTKLKKITNKNINFITNEDILEVISKKCNIPLIKDKEKLIINLNTELNKVVFGQKEAINKVVSYLNKRLKDNGTPISFLFNGGCGVGKTYLAKTLSKCLNMNLIKLDMSEYGMESSINKLIGTTAGFIGYDDEPIFNKFRNNPYSCLLIENIEMGSNDIKKLIEQILDDGVILNGKNEEISFKNAIVIITSNVKETKKVGFNTPTVASYDSFMTPNFINKIDEKIEFKNITKEDVLEYLNEFNINDTYIINEIDYINNGFRNINKIIKNKEKQSN